MLKDEYGRDAEVHWPAPAPEPPVEPRHPGAEEDVDPDSVVEWFRSIVAKVEAAHERHRQARGE
jgi:hypothetical protein